MRGSWGAAGVRAESTLASPHCTSIPPVSPEIRMSKPLEAEKQGLDSPSEHTGVWEGGGGRGQVWGGLRGQLVTTRLFPPIADTERNGPDTNHQVRREWMRRGVRAERREQSGALWGQL